MEPRIHRVLPNDGVCLRALPPAQPLHLTHLYTYYHHHHQAPPPRPLALDTADTDSIVAPQASLIEGQWDYHSGLRRQRLEYALPLSTNDDADDESGA